MSATASILLAAGPSRRLGTPKQLVDVGGVPLLEVVISEMSSWPVDRIVVVLGSSSEEILAAVDFGECIVVFNEDWDEGAASSLRVGLDVLTREPHWERTFVAVGDQPAIPADVPLGLLAASEETTRPAIVPVYRYSRGDPVLFDRMLWPRLMTMEGDTTPEALLRTHPEWVEEVRFSHLAPRDVDTQDDVADLEARSGHGPGFRKSR